MSSASISLPEETKSFRPVYMGASTAFCIQLFCIDEKHEARQVLIPRSSAMVRNTLGYWWHSISVLQSQWFPNPTTHPNFWRSSFKSTNFWAPFAEIPVLKICLRAIELGCQGQAHLHNSWGSGQSSQCNDVLLPTLWSTLFWGNFGCKLLLPGVFLVARNGKSNSSWLWKKMK